MKDPETTPDEKRDAMVKLGDLLRDSSPLRGRNRCQTTGCSRRYVRRCGLSRIAFREMICRGEIPWVRSSRF
jgi:small subunit ribosomal protein S14